MAPLFTISVAAYGQTEATRRCLKSVLSSGGNFELILVDNGSPSGISELVAEIPDERLFLLRLDENLGFGAAHNLSLASARGTYFVVLNNDAEVSPGWLEKFRSAFLADPLLAVCGADGTHSHLNALGCGGPGPADYVEGSCLATYTHLARKHGLFDPAFRMAYCEDADYSLRMRKLGYRILHIDIGLRHDNPGLTSRSLRDSGQDLDGWHAYNHAVLQSKWPVFLRTKNMTGKRVIRRTGAVGDLLMLTPVISEMRRQHRDLEISIQTAAPEAIRQCGMAALSREPDVDLDGCYERKPWLHPTLAFAEAIGVDGFGYRPIFKPESTHRYEAKAERPIGRYAFLHTNIGNAADWPGRQWNGFLGVSTELTKRGWNVRWCDGSGFPTLSRLAAEIEQADLFVGLDSAPMHLARAAEIPTVGIFGSIDPKLRLTPGCAFERGVTARKVGCLGCHHVRPAPVATGLCFRDRIYCMEKIELEDVIEAIEQVLEAKRMFLETSKVREEVLPYFEGDNGIDVGCRRDPLKPECVAFDKEELPEVTHVGDARKLPFEDARFSWLWSSHCLEDIADTEAALREWARVVKPGGVIGLYVPHPMLYRGFNEDHVHAGFTPEDLEEILRGFGCSILLSRIDDGLDRYSTLVIARLPSV